MESSFDYYEFMNKCTPNVQKFLNDAFGFYRYLAFTKSHSINDDELRLDYSFLLSSILNQDLLAINPYNNETKTMVFNYFDIKKPKACYDDYERKTIFNLFLIYFTEYTNQAKIDPQKISIELIMLNVLKNEEIIKFLKYMANVFNKETQYEVIFNNLKKALKMQEEQENLGLNKKIIASLNAPMQQYLHIALCYYAKLKKDIANQEEIALFLSGIYLISLVNEEEKNKIFKYFNLTSDVTSISSKNMRENIKNFADIIELINEDEMNEYPPEFLEENNIYIAFYKLLIEFSDCFTWLNTLFDENYYNQLVSRLKHNINTKIANWQTPKGENKPSKRDDKILASLESSPKIENKNSSALKKNAKYLTEYGLCLNNLNYEFNPAVGREKEIINLKMDLLKSKSIILIGEAGVGKTAIVKALANDLKNGNVPNLLKGLEIVRIDIHSLIAGTKYRGEFEEKIKNVIKDLQKNPQVILYIEELHTVKGLGDSSNSSYDLMNMLKPYLSNGDFKIIGDTTIEEYDNFIAQDAAFSRRFITEMIEEPTPKALKDILIHKIDEFTKRYNINFNFGVANENLIIESLIALTDTQKQAYFSTRKNPDLIIDALENIFAYAAYNSHQEVTYDDVFKGMNLLKDVSDAYKQRIIYELQNLLKSHKSQVKSRVIKFPSIYSLK